MKRGTPQHHKTARLGRELGISRAQAVGHLEMLWHYTARYAPRGDIGIIPKEDIAENAGWDGKPSKFIKALVKVGWIDDHQEHGLIIHDWHEHADDSTKKVLEKKGWAFINGEPPRKKKAESFANDSRTGREGVASDSRPALAEAEPKPKPEPKPVTEAEADGGIVSASDGFQPRDHSVSFRSDRRDASCNSFLLSIEHLFAKQPPQSDADRTSAYRMFDDLIWPEHVNGDGEARVKLALSFVDTMPKTVKKCMAWLTTRVQKEFG